MTARLPILTLLAILAAASVATAQPKTEAPASGSTIEVLFQPPKLPDPKQSGDVPLIETTVIGAANVPMDKFTLIDQSVKPPVEMKAIKMVDFKKGNEPLAVAIVMNGWELWIGNDREVPQITKDDPTRRPGVLVDLRSALDRLNFKDAGPAGSKGVVITYADKAVIRVPMGPLGDITGTKLGTQADYYGSTGVEMVAAIRLAIAQLHDARVARKVLIVVCDGNDTNPEAAKSALAQLKREAHQEQIQTFAIVYKAPDSLEHNLIPIMIPQTQIVTTAENIATSIASILARMDDRKYVTFAGYVRDKSIGFTWDDKVHKLMVKVDKDESEQYDVKLPLWSPDPDDGFPWLVLILILVGVLLLIIIAVKVFSTKAEPAPPPMPMMAPAPMPEPPKPMGPMKTVMIGQGGDEGGFPVVGWLVPLNGQHAYQTMRLRSSTTKVGTAPPADIVINDGFMSTEHCQINCSPQGFTLIDNGSTNGSYVNERKIIGKHDLVDNDVVTLGKTSFKFKSIV